MSASPVEQARQLLVRIPAEPAALTRDRQAVLTAVPPRVRTADGITRWTRPRPADVEPASWRIQRTRSRQFADKPWAVKRWSEATERYRVKARFPTWAAAIAWVDAQYRDAETEPR